MKVLCYQEVVSPYLDGVISCQVTTKVSAPQVGWFVLCLWLRKGILENMAWSKAIDFESVKIYPIFTVKIENPGKSNT